MIIRNSIRQLWRMKGKTFLFILLLLLASGLCSMGVGFWKINSRNMEKYEDSFMTIGTVEQKASTMQEIRQWDAETKSYHIYSKNVYDTYVPESVLDFEGADYLSSPEKRVTYIAYNPDYKTYDGLNQLFVVEVSPREDVVPDHPVLLEIKKVWHGTGLYEGMYFTFCSHYDPEPEMMYQDKTYIMCVDSILGHESEVEFRPVMVTESDQYAADGTIIENSIAGHYYDEVTEDFYESERGRRWLNFLECLDYRNNIFPVTGTDNIHLMMGFYRGDNYISFGREFTEEEYESGAKVCLVSEPFAYKNGFEVGDSVRLPLLCADHKYSGGASFGSAGFRSCSFLNAQGEIYEPFEDSEYEIVGIYGGVASSMLDEYSMGYNEVVIPAKSVKNSDADNIIAYGPMFGSTTSFEIENGTIDEYMEKWSRQGIDNVEITFYDKGYTKLQSGMENMKSISRILAAMGAAMVLMVLGYFTWLFILRQGERTAVERCLGFRKWQSFLSMFTGIFLIILVGSALGCTAGSVLSARIAGSMENISYYDTTFGNSAAVEMEEDIELEEETFYPVEAAAGTMAAVLVTGSVMAGIGIGCNLRKEPMELLGKAR
ncbi:MAG: hypothetical protein J6K48_15870 [Lachnospiraceae bacterium]|nr:hypothetical protein [Lachnospiraceae bacterium]